MEALKDVNVTQPGSLEAASSAIRLRFLQAQLPDAVSDAITRSYQQLGEDSAVAVRSSATAEDLPELSFAGQQETFLNVRGAETLLESVRHCWASLWTARAIGYRSQHGIDHRAVSLAVVVQRLVNAEASGVLFTANPITGQQGQAVINGAWGLGEAIVGGLVTPDTIVVEKASGEVIERRTADKLVMIVRAARGTIEQATPDHLRRAPVLNDQQAAQLVQLGVQIDELYGRPMDIEWTWASGEFAIVQARPITALPPEPAVSAPIEWPRPNPKAMYARGSLAEHLPNPVSPLFGTLGIHQVNLATDVLGREFLGADGSAEYQYRTLNGYMYMGFVFGPKQMWTFAKAGFSQLDMMLGKSTQRWRQARVSLMEVVARWEAKSIEALLPTELLNGVREVLMEAGRFYTVIQSGTLGTATSSEIVFTQLYNKLIRRTGDPAATVFLFGFDTVPILAEKALFDLATFAQEHAALCHYVGRTPTDRLAAALKSDQPPDDVPVIDWLEWQVRFRAYLTTHGRIAYDFDFVNPTPAEAPEPLLDTIKMFMAGHGSNPYERQRIAAQRREEAAAKILARIGWPRKGWFKKALGWAQRTVPVREDSLADMTMGHPIIRRMLNELGYRFTAGGAIQDVADIYWLEEAEVEALIAALERGETLPDHSDRVSVRKAQWQAQRQLNPPAMLPEDSRWAKMMPWARQNQEGQTIKGVGTSAGKVTATARVLFGPEDFSQMRPGDVLVAVTTTPAWTPLFVMASAVVTDIGGPLSHSSIVAREYGIPAVMATSVGTRRIHSGQMITVDGGAGTVTLT